MALSKDILDGLGQEEKLLGQTIQDIDSQIEELSKARQAATQQWAAIGQLIGNTKRTVQDLGVADSSTGVAGKTFRDTIRTILSENVGPMMPKQVEKALIASGFTDAKEIKTPLASRVGSELFKLSQRGDLVREEAGYKMK